MQNIENRSARRTLTIREEAVRDVVVSEAARDERAGARFEMAPDPHIFNHAPNPNIFEG